MRFAAWPAVYLLALVPALLALYAYAFRRRRQALAAFVAHEVAPRLLPPPAWRRRWLRASCLVAAAACFVIALMQPEWGGGAKELPLRGRDLIVLLDVSHSMLAEDVAPNRLAQAKAAARSLALAVQREGGHRLGLLTFAGRADVQCPLTRDYGLFLKRLEDATPDGVARRGTSIGEAVRQAVRAFGELAPGYTDLVLITDGEDHASLPLEAAEMLGALRIDLSTVGVGDPNRSAPIPIAAGDDGVDYLIHNGEEVQSRMRSGLLVGMAQAAGGTYIGADAGPAGLDRWYAEEVGPKPRRELESATSKELAPQYRYFIVLAIALLVLELIMRASRGDTA
jgi:Ca-activated chloride channel family protein